jgi:hypothetical protein
MLIFVDVHIALSDIRMERLVLQTCVSEVNKRFPNQILGKNTAGKFLLQIKRGQQRR